MNFQRCSSLLCCFSGSATNEPACGPQQGPKGDDLESRRRLHAEAAERRRADFQSRGLADPQGVKRKQDRLEQKQSIELPRHGGPELRWNVN